MFKIGDKIVYPMHGAGIITEVQNKEVLGVKKDYYILQMPMGEMKISIPVDKINDMGIRFVAQEETIHSLRDILKNSEVDFPSNWNKRYKENLEKCEKIIVIIKSKFCSQKSHSNIKHNFKNNRQYSSYPWNI